VQTCALPISRAKLLRESGLEPGRPVPAALRSQVRALEEEQKRRARRATLDTIDRALVDLLSFYRDVLTVQLGSDVDLINTTRAAAVREIAAATTKEASLRAMEAITHSRSEEHTSELQSRFDLVCRLLLEKKK